MSLSAPPARRTSRSPLALATLAQKTALGHPPPDPHLAITAASDPVRIEWTHDPRPTCGLIASGRHVEHRLNGKRVLSCDLDGEAYLGAVRKFATFGKCPRLAKATKGCIAHRHDGTDGYFRNLRVPTLP